MYKTQYTPEEAQEMFRQVEESNHHEARKARMKRYVQARVVESAEVAEN
jgi:hypothetical protein